MSLDPRTLHDPRWDDIAAEWLDDAEVPDHVAQRHIAKLAQQLHDCAEQYVTYDLVDYERDRDQAAYDDHINRKIDEARGK